MISIVAQLLYSIVRSSQNSLKLSEWKYSRSSQIGLRLWYEIWIEQQNKKIVN